MLLHSWVLFKAISSNTVEVEEMTYDSKRLVFSVFSINFLFFSLFFKLNFNQMLEKKRLGEKQNAVITLQHT